MTLSIPIRRGARLAAALLPLALAGCSPDAHDLIRVGRHVVTVSDFESLAAGNESQYLGTPDSAKRQLFDDLLKRAMLLREAEARGLYQDAVVLNVRRNAEEKALSDALLARLRPASVPVSQAEIVRQIAWRDTAHHVQLIYAPTRRQIDAALAELRSGAPFTMVANRHNLAGFLPPGGDVGFILPGTLVPPLDDLMRRAPVGELVGPVDAPGEGYFLMMVLAHEPRPQPEMGTRHSVMREMLQQRKVRLAALLGYQRLKREYDLTVLPEAGPSLYASLNSHLGEQLQGMGQTLPPPVEPDSNTVLARWRDATGTPHAFTHAEAMADYLAGDARVDPTNSTALSFWVEQQAMKRVLLAEARRRKLDEEPDVRRKIEQAVDNHVVQIVYEQDVVPEAQLIPSDPRAWYGQIKDNFQHLEELTVDRVTIADSAKAIAVTSHGAHAPTLVEALKMAGASEPIERVTVRYPTQDPTFKSLEASFLRLGPGQSVGAFPVKGGWQILRIVSKRQRAAEYEELEPQLRQLVDNQAEERRREIALDKVVEHLKKQYPPVLHPERLKRIPWPVRGDDASLLPG